MREGQGTGAPRCPQPQWKLDRLLPAGFLSAPQAGTPPSSFSGLLFSHIPTRIFLPSALPCCDQDWWARRWGPFPGVEHDCHLVLGRKLLLSGPQFPPLYNRFLQGLFSGPEPGRSVSPGGYVRQNCVSPVACPWSP